MGMPRALRKKMELEFDDSFELPNGLSKRQRLQIEKRFTAYFVDGWNAAKYWRDRDGILETINDESKGKGFFTGTMKSLFIEDILCIKEKPTHRILLEDEEDELDPTRDNSMDKVEADRYTGLQSRNDGNHQPTFSTITISRFFLPKLKDMNVARERRDRAEVRLREEILEIRGTVYEQRCFPPKLRRIIFERDNYRCQTCGKHKSELIAEGRKLQVDHIIAFIDGGRTCYDNGEAICGNCNIGKHHAKAYLQNIYALK